jgi:hypothetical protein
MRKNLHQIQQELNSQPSAQEANALTPKAPGPFNKLIHQIHRIVWNFRNNEIAIPYE